MEKIPETYLQLKVSDLKKLYRDLSEASNIRVTYSDNQLEMANQAIINMKFRIDGWVNFLKNKGIENFVE